MKPYEVEILVCEVGPENNAYFQILYDGTITDRRNCASVGGDSDEIQKVLNESWKDGISLAAAVALSRQALIRSANGSDRRRQGRTFRRLGADEVKSLLA